jgi:hypothetical protein
VVEALGKDSIPRNGAVMVTFLCRGPCRPSAKALPSARQTALGKGHLCRLKIPREPFAEGRPRQSLCRGHLVLCRGLLALGKEAVSSSACSACMRVRVHWRTAARSRTYSAVGVSWRASERRSLSSRSFIVKHLLVRVICAKSPIPRTLPSRPIPRCHHTQPPLHAYAIIGGAGPC